MKTPIAILVVALLVLLSGCATTQTPPQSTPQPEKIVSVPHFKSVTENFVTTTTLAEFYKKMEFNPNGNSVEIVAFSDPIGAMKAREIKEESVALSKKLYPKEFTFDTVLDAFRHAYFSFRLSQEIGVERTKKFTDAYEISHVNPPASRCMDLWNNLQGRLMYIATKAEKIDKKTYCHEYKRTYRYEYNKSINTLQVQVIQINNRKRNRELIYIGS